MTTAGPRFGDLLVLVLIQDELSCLARWINDQRITVESVQHDRVLRAQVVGRQAVCLPAKTVVGIRQILQQTSTAYHIPITANYIHSYYSKTYRWQINKKFLPPTTV